MKHKTIVIAAALTLFISAHTTTAQTTKGHWLIEANLGNIRFYQNKSESSTGNTIYKSEYKVIGASLMPRIGYFITPAVAVGTTFEFYYQYNKSTSYAFDGFKDSETKQHLSTIGLSPFLRYYFLGKESKNKFYAQIGGGMATYIVNKYEATSVDHFGKTTGKGTGSAKGQSISAEALIGFNHFFNDHVAFNTSLGYSYNSNHITGTSTYTYGTIVDPVQVSRNSSISNNIVWNFGFTMLIAGKKQS